ncbi:ribonuclease pancreatic-like [Leptodactylus fuscus]|uniref:ribonuclease pancreatic-like n=1 Tax=Leptodactylus fuscus TaxID=238119 RepID=UPI003F4E8EBD
MSPVQILLVTSGLLLLGSASCSQSNQDVSDFSDFARRHIVTDETLFTSCTHYMRSKGISTVNGNRCKPVNTFIFDSREEVKRICPEGSNKMCWSLNTFMVIVCSHVKNSMPPDCKYTKKEDTRKYIEVKCESGEPVHLNRTNKTPPFSECRCTAVLI